MHDPKFYLDPASHELTELLEHDPSWNDASADAYAFLDGPTVRFGQNWLDLARLIAKNPRISCKIQKYHRVDDGPFRPAFAHPATVIIDFYLFQPSADPHSAFQAQLTGKVVSVVDPDAFAAKDQLLPVLSPLFDITFDYDPLRGIGLFQQLSLTHHWTQRPNALPYLMTTINLELMRSQVRVISLADKIITVGPEPEHTNTGTKPSDQTPPVPNRRVAES